MAATNFEKYFSTIYFKYADFFDNSTTYIVKPEQLPDMFRDAGVPFQWNGEIPSSPIDYKNWILLLIKHSRVPRANGLRDFVEYTEFHTTIVNYAFELVFQRLELPCPDGLTEMMKADGTPFRSSHATEVIPKDFDKYLSNLFFRYANYDEGCRNPTVNRVHLPAMCREVSLPFQNHGHTIPTAGIDYNTWINLLVEHSHAQGCNAMVEILESSNYDPYIINFAFEKIFNNFNKPYPDGIDNMTITNR